MMRRRILQIAGFTALFVVHNFAFATAPFLNGGNQLKSDLISILTPIFGIGLLAAGGLALFGKIHWAWLGAAVVGAVLIFANDQVVSWLRTLFA